MRDARIRRVAMGVVAQGLAGAGEVELLHGFCTACREAGLELGRALALIDTLHPIHEGRAFRWRGDRAEEEPLLEYGRSSSGEAAATWQRSAFHHLLTTGTSELRRRFCRGEPADFYRLDELLADGQTDYIAMIHRFRPEGTIGEMDCFYSHWTSIRPNGFRADELRALRRLIPPLALAIKCASLARIAGTLAQVYLGRDAGRRVLEGRIARGVAERIGAVLWFSDLRSYTRISDGAPPEEIIPLLDDYAEAVIGAVHGAGGDVLKLIGDGTLAIFTDPDPASACRAALWAEADLRRRLALLNRRRAGAGRPVTTAYLGLHIGDVFYGNIGSDERLDFTVIGPAVNETARIAALCRSVDRTTLISAAFAAELPAAERASLVSVGRYALRGVGRAQDLFTLDSEGEGPAAPEP